MSVDRKPLLSGLEDVEDMDERITRGINEVKRKLDLAPKMNAAQLRDLIRDSETAIDRIQNTCRGLKIEIKEIPLSSQKIYESKLAQHNSDIGTLQLRITNLKSREPTSVRESPKEVYYQTMAVQDDSISSLQRTKKVIEQTKDIGIATNVALKQQTEQLKSIGEDVDLLQENLEEASKQLRSFMRRMATDKFILCVLCLIVLGIIFAISYSIATGKSPFKSGGDAW